MARTITLCFHLRLHKAATDLGWRTLDANIAWLGVKMKQTKWQCKVLLLLCALYCGLIIERTCHWKSEADHLVALLARTNPGFSGSSLFYQRSLFGPVRVRIFGSQILNINAVVSKDLRFLDISETSVSDISCLKGSSLEELTIDRTRVTDLQALQGMPLRKLSLESTYIPAENFVNVNSSQLQELNLSGSMVSDLTFLRTQKLKTLDISHTVVRDLSPLSKVSLEWLNIDYTKITDLSPLKDVQLRHLSLAYTDVQLLDPIQDARLTFLDLTSTKVRSILSLRDAPLRVLLLSGSHVVDVEPLSRMPLIKLSIPTTVVDSSPVLGLGALEWLELPYNVPCKGAIESLPSLVWISGSRCPMLVDNVPFFICECLQYLMFGAVCMLLSVPLFLLLRHKEENWFVTCFQSILSLSCTLLVVISLELWPMEALITSDSVPGKLAHFIPVYFKILSSVCVFLVTPILSIISSVWTCYTSGLNLKLRAFLVNALYIPLLITCQSVWHPETWVQANSSILSRWILWF